VSTWDENGWLAGALAPLELGAAWSLFAPEPSSRIDEPRLRAQAERFFRARLALATPKRYPDTGWPLADAAELDVAPATPDASPTRVRIVTLPLDRAPALLAAANAGAAAIGGAGMDALVAKARRLWQVDSTPLAGDDTRAPLVAAAVLASVLLAPLVPPGGGTIFGVKGARERLESLGWRT
jgi:hypothetical protein